MGFVLDGRMLYRDRAGIGRYIWELQRELARLRSPIADRMTLLVDVRDERARCASLPTRRAVTPARHALETLAMPIELRFAEAAHFPDHGIPDGVRVPSIVTVHDVSFLTHPDAYHPNSRAFYMKAVGTLQRAAHVITVSEWARREILDRRLADPTRVTVVPEAPASFPKTPFTDVSPEGWAPYGLVLGTIQPRKNLIRAAKAFVNSHAGQHLQLLVVGSLGYRGVEIVREVRAVDPKHRIRFVGQISDRGLARCLRDATFVLVPSLEEGFGLSALEAMAAGVPCVISETGALVELTAGAALTVDPTDVDSILSGVDRLVGDPGLQTRLVERGRMRASEFSWERTAALTAEIYREVA